MTRVPAEGFVTNEGDGTPVWYLDSLMTVLAGGEDTGGRLGVLEVRARPGMSGPLHVHRRQDEAFYVLGGQILARCGDWEFTAAPGAFVWFPRDVPHQITTVGDAESPLLEFSVPSGIELFHRDAGLPAPALMLPDEPVAADPQILRRLAAEYGIEVLAPPGAGSTATA